jgi:hypothetical protein
MTELYWLPTPEDANPRSSEVEVPEPENKNHIDENNTLICFCIHLFRNLKK